MMNVILTIAVGIVSFGVGIIYCAYFIGTRINSTCTEEEKIEFKRIMRKIYN